MADARGAQGGQGLGRGQNQQHKADKDWRRGGHKADKDWRSSQSQQHKAHTSGGQGLEARPKPTTQGGHMAEKLRRRGGKDTRRTSGGQGLEARPKPTTQGGQVADTRRSKVKRKKRFKLKSQETLKLRFQS